MRNEKEENKVKTEVNARHKQQTVHLRSESGGGAAAAAAASFTRAGET